MNIRNKVGINLKTVIKDILHSDGPFSEALCWSRYLSLTVVDFCFVPKKRFSDFGLASASSVQQYVVNLMSVWIIAIIVKKNLIGLVQIFF